MFTTDEELVAGTRDLLEEGALSGDLVMVYGGHDELAVFRGAWDDDPRITFTDLAELYRNPMAALVGFQRMLERENQAGRRVRMTAPVPYGEDPLRRTDWMRYEALVDRALAPYDYISMCQYDTRRLGEELVAHAWATHDRVLTSEGSHPGGQQRERVLADLASPVADPLEDEPTVYQGALTSSADLTEMRAGLRSAPPRLVTAVNEVATNALQHGHPPVAVRLHRGAEGWLCVVTNHGPALGDPYAGIDSPLPGNSHARGRGLWVARQLCDHLTIDTGGHEGTTIRLSHFG